MRKQFLCACVCLAISSSITARSSEPVFETFTIRQKAMGGVQVATFKNVSSFAQNPAILAAKRSWRVALPRFEAGVNKGFLDKYSDLTSMVSESDETAQIEALKSLVPLNISSRFSLQPLFTLAVKNVAFSTFAEGFLVGDLARKTSPTFTFEGRGDINYVGAFAKSFEYRDRTFHVGVAPKYTQRHVIYDPGTGKNKLVYTQAELMQIANGFKEAEIDTYSMSGFGLDFGLLLPVESFEGQVGISVKNLISSLSGTRMVDSVEEDVTASLPFLMSLGVNRMYKLPFLGKFELAADYNLIAPTDNIFKRIHFGGEKRIWKILALRGGVHQGFIVGGFGLNLFFLNLDYAYFAEELSATLGSRPMETHNLQIGLFF